MNIGAKGRRRLLLLLVIVLVLGALGGGAYLVRQGQLNDRARAELERGRAALAEENYGSAITGIRRYLRRFDGDPRALAELAEALSKYPQSGPGEIQTAIASLRRARLLDPDLPGTESLLMDLYVRAGFQQEALDVADRLLRTDPENGDALWTATVGHYVLRQFDEALEFGRRYVEARPEDRKGYFHLLTVMGHAKVPADEVKFWATALAEAHPGDLDFLLLKANALLVGESTDLAREQLLVLAEGPLPDVVFARRLIALLNLLREQEVSTNLVLRAAEQFPEGALIDILIRRLWERGRFEEITAKLDELRPGDRGDLPVTSTGIEALSLLRSGRIEAARTLFTTLEGKPDKTRRDGWLELLEPLLSGSTPPSLRQRIESAAAAVNANPAEPIFHFVLAEAYESAGEYQQAVRSFAEAARVSLSWAKPAVRAAKRLIVMGYPQAALEIAKLAEDRWKDEPELRDVVALLRGATLSAVSPDQRREIIDRMAAGATEGDLSSSTIRVTSMVLNDRMDEAVSTIRADIARDDIDERTLINFTWLATRYDLGIADECLSRYEERFGRTVALQYYRASRLAADGDKAEGLRLLEKGRDAAKEPDRRDWMLARARYLDRTGQPEAVAAWRELADLYPADAAILGAVADADSTWADLTLIQSTADRLRAITGDEGLQWRTLKARLLLSNPDAQERDLAEGVDYLRKVLAVAPHLRNLRLSLGRALRRLGNDDAALEQYRIASLGEVPNAAVQLEFAWIYERQGNVRLAKEHLDKLAALNTLTPDAILETARIYQSIGEPARALSLLERLPASATDESGRGGMLRVQLLSQLGRESEAEQLLDALAMTPSRAVLEFAAQYYAARQNFEKADECFAGLKGLGIGPFDLAILEGDHYRTTNRLAESIESYEGARKLEPLNPLGWRRSLSVLAAAGEKERFLDTFDECLENPEREKSFPDLIGQRSLLEFALGVDGLKVLMVVWIENPERASACAQGIQIVRERVEGGLSRGAYLGRLSSLTDANQDFWPLKSLVIAEQRRAGNMAEALRLARRAVLSLPAEIEPRRVLAEVLLEARRPDEALGHAKAWREKSPKDQMIADSLIGRIHLARNAPEEAAVVLKPWVESLTRAGGWDHALFIRYGQALVQTGRIKAARELMWPQLEKSGVWRALACEFVIFPDRFDEPEAVAWLRQVEKFSPAEEFEETLMLARAWTALSHFHENYDHLAHASGLIDRLKKTGDPTANLWVLIGMFEEYAKDFKAAEEAYRRAIEKDADQHVAKNNLALLLASRSEFKDALELARGVVTASPKDPEYRDTLALIYIKDGRLAEAIEQLKAAEEIEPDNMRWKVALSELLLDAGREQEAKVYYAKVRAALNEGRPISDALRAKTDTLRERIR